MYYLGWFEVLEICLYFIAFVKKRKDIVRINHNKSSNDSDQDSYLLYFVDSYVKEIRIPGKGEERSTNIDGIDDWNGEIVEW